jgi:hypothetical protein
MRTLRLATLPAIVLQKERRGKWGGWRATPIEACEAWMACGVPRRSAKLALDAATDGAFAVDHGQGGPVLSWHITPAGEFRTGSDASQTFN